MYWKSDEYRKMLFLFLVLKSRRKLYNAKVKDLQKLTGWSYNTVKKYLEKGQKNGLLSVYGNVIVATSWKKMPPKSRGKHIILPKSYQQFCKQIKDIVFDKEISSQTFLISLRNTNKKGNVKSVQKIKDLKWNVKKYLTRPQQGGKSANCVRHGYRNLARKLGINVSKVKEELERFKKDGLISSFESRMYYGKRSYRSTTKIFIPIDRWLPVYQKWTTSFSSSVFDVFF